MHYGTGQVASSSIYTRGVQINKKYVRFSYYFGNMTFEGPNFIFQKGFIAKLQQKCATDNFNFMYYPSMISKRGFVIRLSVVASVFLSSLGLRNNNITKTKNTIRSSDSDVKIK